MKEKLLAWIAGMEAPEGQSAMVMPMLQMALAGMSEADVCDMVRQLRQALAALDEC